jgi:hypothetical protein
MPLAQSVLYIDAVMAEYSLPQLPAIVAALDGHRHKLQELSVSHGSEFRKHDHFTEIGRMLGRAQAFADKKNRLWAHVYENNIRLYLDALEQRLESVGLFPRIARRLYRESKAFSSLNA